MSVTFGSRIRGRVGVMAGVTLDQDRLRVLNDLVGRSPEFIRQRFEELSLMRRWNLIEAVDKLKPDAPDTPTQRANAVKKVDMLILRPE